MKKRYKIGPKPFVKFPFNASALPIAPWRSVNKIIFLLLYTADLFL